MLNVFLALVTIAAVGSALHHVIPDIDSTRRQCGSLVLNVLLPALNVEVIYKSPLGRELWQVPLAMLIGAAICVGISLLVFSNFPMTRQVRSSLILGSAFGNVTYLGMPLLRGMFPEQLLFVTKIAILCEITVTSADLIAGALLAMFYQKEQQVSLGTALVQIAKFPILWSAVVAAIIRLLGVPLPRFVLTALELLGQSTSGLMLLVLGMALKPSVVLKSVENIRNWWPVLMIKFGLSPLVVGFVGASFGLSALSLHATTMEASMPPQLFIFVIADRFGFDTEMLAAVVACMTMLSLGTIPIVNHIFT